MQDLDLNARLALGSGDPVAPQPTRSSRKAISEFALDIASRLHFGPGGSLPILVCELGGRVIYRSKPPADGRAPYSLLVRAPADFDILLPTMTSCERENLTAAHELGHFLLHYPLAVAAQKPHPAPIMLAYAWPDPETPDLVRADHEANWFAAAFLMPKAPFADAYRSGGARAASQRFRVPLKSAELRAHSLGLTCPPAP